MWRYLVACIAATWLHYLASQLALKPRTRDLTGDKASPLRATRVCLIDWSFCPRHDASGWWICTAVSTTFTRLIPFWEANSHSARQEISRPFSEFYCRVHRSPELDPIQSKPPNFTCISVTFTLIFSYRLYISLSNGIFLSES